MKFLFVFILIFIIFSCGSESEEDCNCKEWQKCEDNKCANKKDRCENSNDCPLGFICDENHNCTVEKNCNDKCEYWQTCFNGKCITKEGYCKDDSMCFNGYKCDKEHKCIEDCGEYYDECELTESVCSGYNKLKKCVMTECGKRLKEFECEEKKGCLKGECVEFSCSDECNPDEEGCGVWDIRSGSFTEPNQRENLFDKYAQYLKWLYSKNMYFGGVAEAFFEDENKLEKVVSLGGLGDSAIWTGTYLGAEAFRYMTTGAYGSFKNMKNLINTLHLWFNVSGTDGLLVRFAAKTQLLNNSRLSGDLRECNPDNSVFCNIPYDGDLYTYKGHISRDQYQGVLLGYSLAYSSLGTTLEELKLKDIIREDILKLIKQLMKTTVIEVQYEIYDDRIPIWLGGSPLKGTKTIDTKFIVVSPNELKDGRVVVKYCSPGHSSADCETNFWGMQEFMPDLKPFLSRLTSALDFIPRIPRAGSAIMLSNIFNIALQVTRGIEEYRDLNNEIKSFYYGNDDEWGNVNNWLDSAEDWEYLNKCGEKYYGINITMEPLFNLIRLERDLNVKSRIINNVLKDKIWKEVKTHKNTFFSYIYLSALENTDFEVLNSANEQFYDFPLTPKVHYGVNLLDENEYPQYASREEGCENQVNHDYAVDVKDRVMSDFIWQRNPWQLYSPANLKRVYPGVDFLLVYWMGRYYNFIDNENSVCLKYE